MQGIGSHICACVCACVYVVCVQAAIVARGMEYCRIDGSVGSAEERHAQVTRFQRPGAKIPVFLLTSQVRTKRIFLHCVPSCLRPYELRLGARILVFLLTSQVHVLTFP